MARRVAVTGDDGTNDLLVSGVIRTNENHVWLVAEHPPLRSDGPTG